jgi:signal transduction histidine kinase
MSIRLRLTLWYSGILTVTLLLFGIGLYYFLSYSLGVDLRTNLKSQAASVVKRIQPAYSMSLDGVNFELLLNGQDMRSNSTYLLQVYNIKSQYKSKSQFLAAYNIELPMTDDIIARARSGVDGYDRSQVGGLQLLIYSYPLVYGGQLLGVLQVAAATDSLNNFLDTLQYTFALAVLITILVAATIGWFLARKVLRPIEQVIVATDQIENGVDLSRRIDYEGPRDEIGRLTGTINNMLARIQGAYTELEQAYAAQRRFVSDASHELRTPLTTIRGNVDLLEKMWRKQAIETAEAAKGLEAGEAGGTGLQQLEGPQTLDVSLDAMKDIAEEAERMSRMVNDLLSLARADAGVQIVKEEVELTPLVEEVVRRAQFLPKKAEWRTGDLSALDEVRVLGSKDYLQQMLFIFIENAFKYTPSGFVELSAVRADDQIGLRIEDTGIGMEKDEIPRIFDRFYRADESRGKTAGTGLGLSIAKWIIDEHGGSVEVKTRVGEGTVFIVWLPIPFPMEEQ